jgi:hypothetical protein
MADPSLYTYPSPLEGYENQEPLSELNPPDNPNNPQKTSP